MKLTELETAIRRHHGDFHCEHVHDDSQEKTNGKDRKRRQRANASQPGQPDNGIVIRLRTRLEDRAKANIVRASSRRR